MADERNEGKEQDSRVGAYGGSNAGQVPEPQQGQEQSGQASAAGREDPSESAVDADEAIGNRTGGYGGWGNDQDQGQVGEP